MKFFLRHSWLYFILNLWESKHLDSEGYVKKKKKKKQQQTFVMPVTAHHLGCWDIFINFSLSILDRYVGWGGHNLFSPL